MMDFEYSDKLEKLANMTTWAELMRRVIRAGSALSVEAVKALDLWFDEGHGMSYAKVLLETNLQEQLAEAEVTLDLIKYHLDAELSIADRKKYIVDRDYADILAKMKMRESREKSGD